MTRSRELTLTSKDQNTQDWKVTNMALRMTRRVRYGDHGGWPSGEKNFRRFLYSIGMIGLSTEKVDKTLFYKL